MNEPLPKDQFSEAEAMPPDQPSADLLSDETLSSTMASRPSDTTNKLTTKAPAARMIWGGIVVLAILS